MTKVLFLPEVVDQFLELAELLYNNGYLGFKESAIDYSEQLFREIQVNLPIKVKKAAPSHFERLAIYLVRYLGNNHVIAHKLID